MEVRRVANAVGKIRADLIAVPIVAGGPVSRELGELDVETGGKLLREVRRRTGEPGKQGTVGVYQTHGEMRADLIAVIGVGRADSGRIEAEAWRRFAGQALEVARGARAKTLAISVASAPGGAAAATALGSVVEGVLLADYQIEGWKTSRAVFRVETCIVAGAATSREAERVAKRAEILADATRFARDLINGPAEQVTPDHLGRTAKRIGRDHGLTVHVYGPEDMKRLKMGAILAVGRGSRNEPRLIELIHRPRRPRRASGTGPVALVGKGITFDSGGLSLKPPASMEIQKRDMAGGAAVLGAMQAIAALKPDIEVRGYVASAENMPDGRAYRPGDVLRAFTGKTIEVLDRQLTAGWPEGATGENLIVAYEPVWAIGTGRTARGADAAAMADAIRDTIAGLGAADLAANVPVLYGGSVTSAAIGEFLAEPSVDGALVGGASLKPDEMAGIVARAAMTAKARGAA